MSAATRRTTANKTSSPPARKSIAASSGSPPTTNGKGIGRSSSEQSHRRQRDEDEVESKWETERCHNRRTDEWRPENDGFDREPFRGPQSGSPKSRKSTTQVKKRAYRRDGKKVSARKGILGRVLEGTQRLNRRVMRNLAGPAVRTTSRVVRPFARLARIVFRAATGIITDVVPYCAADFVMFSAEVAVTSNWIDKDNFDDLIAPLCTPIWAFNRARANFTKYRYERKVAAEKVRKARQARGESWKTDLRSFNRLKSSIKRKATSCAKFVADATLAGLANMGDELIHMALPPAEFALSVAKAIATHDTVRPVWEAPHRLFTYGTRELLGGNHQPETSWLLQKPSTKVCEMPWLGYGYRRVEVDREWIEMADRALWHPCQLENEADRYMLAIYRKRRDGLMRKAWYTIRSNHWAIQGRHGWFLQAFVPNDTCLQRSDEVHYEARDAVMEIVREYRGW